MAKPIKNIRVGGVQLSIWENQTENGAIKSITLNKSYKDKKTDTWKNTNNFKGNDLPHIEVAIREAMEFLYLKGDPDNENF